MRIAIVGGGPGGLYAALLLKQDDESREIDVYDRNPPDATYGWGVVFSDETVGFLEDADPASYARIVGSFVRWDAIDIYFKDQKTRCGGNAFSGLSRRMLLAILQTRCRELGVRLHFDTEAGEALAPTVDLVVAADGLNSRIRQAFVQSFKPTLDVHGTRYIWLGVDMRFDAFTFVFRETPAGMFQVHAYPFDRRMSTFIVECGEDTWKRARLDRTGEPESMAFCKALFGDVVGSHKLFSNRSSWINFITLRNESWRHENVVLLGDAAHTAHFSVGSGTKLAMEDAIALQSALRRHSHLSAALVDYEELRRPVVERTQQAARESSLWFEHTARHARFQPTQFAFSLLTRSRRVTYQNLRLRDPEFSRGVDLWFRETAGASLAGPAPLSSRPRATPFQMRSMRLEGRLVARLPNCDAAENGEPAPLMGADAVHLGKDRDLILTPIAAVCADARISPGCVGMYSERHQESWAQIVDTVHHESLSRIGIRLGHAGRRGACRARTRGVDVPLADGAWQILSASPLPYAKGGQIPREATREDMDLICRDFVRAATLAESAGFDMLELTFGHGYLIGSFLSPLSNVRTDEYGGSIENRMRFPLRVAREVRDAWPAGRPMSASISVQDHVPGGIYMEESIQVAMELKRLGCDCIHVGSGQTTANANPPYGRMWQAPYADAIRNEAQVATLLDGGITNGDEVDTLLAAGRADLCIVGADWTAEAPRLSFLEMVRR